MGDLADALIWRTIGSVGGTVIALAIVLPKTTSGFFQRLTVSMFSGWMLAPTFISYMNWASQPDDMIAASCIVSACSWWGWHAAIRLVQMWRARE